MSPIATARTPAARRAQLFRTIARYWSAGISPQWIGNQLERGARDPLTRAVGKCLSAGQPLSAAFKSAGTAVPPTHITVIEAAERSGRIPEVLDDLAGAEETQLTLRGEAIARTAYPVLVFHMAVLAPQAGLLVTGKLLALVPSLLFLAVFDIALAGVYRILFGATTSAMVDRIVLRTPVLGRLLVDGDLRRYLVTTHHLYEAGIGLPDAMRTAAGGLARPQLRDRVTLALAQIPPETQPFAHLGIAFPDRPELAALLETSFQTGDLTTSMRQLEQALAVSEADGMRRFVKLLGGVLFGAAALLVLIVAVSFYGNLYKGLR